MLTSVLFREVVVGFSGIEADLEDPPGRRAVPWGDCGGNGSLYCNRNYRLSLRVLSGPTFTVNDTIGCGFNFTTGCAFFTKNGVFLGELSSNSNHP